MIDGQRVLAIVPARGGSKGIPLKNLRSIGGRSLVARVGDIISAVPEIDRSIVSTDHEEIAWVAEKAGISAPFRRPADISGDQIADWDVLIHALNAIEVIDKITYQIVVMLQPTSPLRTVADVSGTIQMLVNGGWDAVWTVSPTDSKAHPLKQLKLQNSELDYWDSRGEQIIARQQLDPVYHRNGVAYAITRDCLLNQRSIKGLRTGGFVITGDHISIDTEWDLELAEVLLAKNDRNITR